MSIRVIWLIALVCAVVSGGSFLYVSNLVQDAPPATCDYFINSLECVSQGIYTQPSR